MLFGLVMKPWGFMILALGNSCCMLVKEDCEIRLGGALRRKFDAVGKWALLHR